MARYLLNRLLFMCVESVGASHLDCLFFSSWERSCVLHESKPRARHIQGKRRRIDFAQGQAHAFISKHTTLEPASVIRTKCVISALEPPVFSAITHFTVDDLIGDTKST